MSTAAQVLALARKELGYNEGRNNDNKYAKQAGHANNQPWCASFVVAIMRAAGITLPSESAYTPAMANGFRKANRWVTKPSPGAVVFFQWPRMGRIAHVGIVESVRPDGSIVTIEGNTNGGGSRTGGAVMRHVRRANIAGYGLPAYSGASGGTSTATGRTDRPGTNDVPGGKKPPYPGMTKQGMRDSAATKAFQQQLVRQGAKIAVDGDHGPATTRALQAFQRAHKLAPDGIGGRMTWAALVA